MMEWKFKKILVVFVKLLQMIQKVQQKSSFPEPDSPKSAEKESSFFNEPLFLISKVLPHTFF